MDKYINALREYMRSNYRKMFREAGGIFPYKFLTPGSASYDDVLWNRDSYLCEKTITLFGRDVLNCGAMHEYYSPEGEPVINESFQNWNMLVLNMIYWYENREYIEEF